MTLSGIIIVDKQQGISSHTEMRRVQRLFGVSKAGHAGTLDPLATGMLPVYFGEATKYIQYALDSDKTYVATGCFGTKTDTADSTGSIIFQHPDPKKITTQSLQSAMVHLTGNITQIPSMYSAIKHQGKPLYYYARKGREIVRPSRNVEIKSFELLDYDWPYFTVNVVCSKGTYIRNLIEDLGDNLALGAHVTELSRQSVLGFDKELMKSYDALTQIRAELLSEQLLSVDFGLQHFEKVILEASEILALQQGKVINKQLYEGIYRIYDFSKNFFGLCRAYFNSQKNIQEVKAHRMMSPK
jgi:tRNA pseudouridine55 synthase